MTLLTGRPVLVGAEPRVDLMPPVLASKAKAKGMLQWLVLVVLLAVLIAVGASSLAARREAAAQTELTAAQDRTTQLLAQRAGYAEVTAALSAENDLAKATVFASSTEVLWSDVYAAIDARLPDTTTIDTITFAGRAPWEPVSSPESIFRLPREAAVTITLTSVSLPEPAQFVERLSDIPGLADVTPSTVTQADGLYTSVVVLHLGADALSNRFSASSDEVQP